MTRKEEGRGGAEREAEGAASLPAYAWRHYIHVSTVVASPQLNSMSPSPRLATAVSHSARNSHPKR